MKDQGGMILVVTIDPDRPPNPLIVEFEDLLMHLHDHSISRKGWDRILAILAVATLEAGNTDAAQKGYDNAVAMWRVSRHFDGRD